MPTAVVNPFSVLAKLVPFGAPSSAGQTVQANGVLDAFGADRIFLREAAGNITGMVRQGADLLVYGPNGEILTVQNFYTGVEAKHLLLLDGNGGVVAMETAVVSDGPMGLYSTQVAEPAPFESLTNSPDGREGSSGGGAAAVVGGLMAAGFAAALSQESDAPTFDSPLPDTTPPAAPTGLTFAANGTSLSGTAEPGSTVTVRNAAGAVIGSAQVGNDGRFTVTLSPALVNSETVSVTATDPANNTSTPSSATAPDLTAPNAATDVVVAADGETVTGKGEPGTTVEIRNNQGAVVGTGQVGADGTFTVTLDPSQIDGSSVSVVLTDAAGNNSAPTTAGSPDLTAPDAPTDLLVGADGDTLSGRGEAGADVEVRDAQNAVIGTGRVNPDGTFSVTLDPAQTEGGTVSVVLKDAAGNTSAPATATAPDLGVEPEPLGTPTLDIPEAADDIDAVDLDDGIDARVGLPNGTNVGDTIVITLTSNGVSTDVTHVVIGDDIALGYVNINLGATYADGFYSVVAILRTADGRDSPPSTPVTFNLSGDEGSYGGTPLGRPDLTIDEAADGVDAGELADGIEARVSLPQGADVGQTITVTMTSGTDTYQVTHVIIGDDIALGYASINLGSTYPDGAYSVVAVITAPDRRVSPASTAVTFDISTTGGITIGTNEAELSEMVPDVAVTGQLAFSNAVNGQVTLGLPDAQGLTSQGEAITWQFAADGTLQGMAGTRLVLSVSMSATGAYSLQIHSGIDHLDADVKAINIPVTVTDASGSSTGTLVINVEDGAPLNGGPITLAPAGPTTLAGSLLVDVGLDGGTLQSVTVDGVTFTLEAGGTLDVIGTSDTITSYALDQGNLLLTTTRGETVTVNLTTGEYNVLVTGITPPPSVPGTAPLVDVGGSSGLGNVLQLNLLGIVGLSKDQAITVADADNDITSLELEFSGLTLLSGSPFRWDGALADELGLRVIPGTGLNSGRITISSTTTGGTIDAFKLNELLGTLTLNPSILGGLLPIDLSLFQSLTARVVDAQGQEGDAIDFTLIDAGVANNLLNGVLPNEVRQGDDNANTLNGLDVNLGQGLDNRIYGYGGDDILNGARGNDLLRGGSGNDTLNGGAGNDILIGGAGNDILTGGEGSDVFRFERGDIALGVVETDVITDFNAAALTSGGDILDLSDILLGEGRIGQSAGNLTSFLHFVQTAEGTEIHIAYRGGFSGGYNLLLVDHKILLAGVDLIGAGASDLGIISRLLLDGKLVVDSATQPAGAPPAADLTIEGSFVDGDGDAGQSTVIVSDDNIGNPSANGAPALGAEAALLQPLLGGTFADYDLGQQDLSVADPDNNLAKVSLEFRSLVGVSLSQIAFGYDATLAHALGYTVKLVPLDGVLGVVLPGIRLEVTAANGLTLDNEQINLFLRTVHLTNGDGGLFDESLLSLGVLNATTLTATDVWGASASDSLGNLLTVNALTTLLGGGGASSFSYLAESFEVGEEGIDVQALLGDLEGAANDAFDLDGSGDSFRSLAHSVLEDTEQVIGDVGDSLAPAHTAFDPAFETLPDLAVPQDWGTPVDDHLQTL